jgi:predicted ArsR family transcriptional regulator
MTDDVNGIAAVQRPDDFGARVTSVAALAEPVRRDLYRFVGRQSEPVSREEAASGVGVPLHTAKFHLDKLVDDGWLDVEYRRPPGRRGPGAGRPAKRYRRSSRQVAVSLPERRYEWAGRLLAQAVTDAERDDVPVSAALSQVVRDEGHALGAMILEDAGPGTRTERREAIVRTLEDCGFEPKVDQTGVTLVNCPFHALADRYTDLVCGMNLGLIDALLARVERTGLEARLDPAPSRCCVRLQVTGSSR